MGAFKVNNLKTNYKKTKTENVFSLNVKTSTSEHLKATDNNYAKQNYRTDSTLQISKPNDWKTDWPTVNTTEHFSFFQIAQVHTCSLKLIVY